MHYFVDNMFRQDKAPYCSNCSRDADCIALLLVRRPVGCLLADTALAGTRNASGFSTRSCCSVQDGEVPRDAEFARVRQYMIRRCRYAAALILNVQARAAVPASVALPRASMAASACDY